MRKAIFNLIYITLLSFVLVSCLGLSGGASSTNPNGGDEEIIDNGIITEEDLDITDIPNFSFNFKHEDPKNELSSMIGVNVKEPNFKGPNFTRQGYYDTSAEYDARDFAASLTKKISEKIIKNRPKFAKKIKSLENEEITLSNLEYANGGQFHVLTFEIPIVPKKGYKNDSDIKSYQAEMWLYAFGNTDYTNASAKFVIK